MAKSNAEGDAMTLAPIPPPAARKRLSESLHEVDPVRSPGSTSPSQLSLRDARESPYQSSSSRDVRFMVRSQLRVSLFLPFYLL